MQYSNKLQFYLIFRVDIFLKFMNIKINKINNIIKLLLHHYT